MLFFDKKYLIIILLIFCFLANSFAQESNYSFTWLDRNEKVMAGSLSCNLVALPVEGQYQLAFSVSWFNQEGKQILDVNKMPILSLSKYDLVKDPAQNLRCAFFEQKKPSSLNFQTTENLNIQVLNGYTGEIKLTAHFQYALTREDYESGKSDLIVVKGSNDLKMSFQVRASKPSGGTDFAKESGRKNETMLANSAAIRQVSANYQKLLERFNDFKGRASADEIAKPDFMKSLDMLSDNVESERSSLNRDSLPADTFQLYRERYSKLDIQVLDFRSEVLRMRISQPDRSGGAALLAGQQADDSVRRSIRSIFEPVITSQLDSLDLLSKGQKSVALEISSLITDPKTRRKSAFRIDSLIDSHKEIRKNFLALELSHENTWKNYRNAIDGYRPVTEIENSHSSFVAGKNDVQSAIDMLDRGVATVRTDQSDTPWYLSTKLVWIGLAVVLLFVFFSGIWSSARNRKIIQAGLSPVDKGNAIGPAGKATNGGLFSAELPDEYFTLDYQETIPESAVGMVHFNGSSIKSVYHLIQAALLERKGDDFGGYLFGNQYKLHGKGTSKSEIFVEKVCDSKYLRSSIANDISARTDLMEELDGLLLQNKKLRMIGWFTSTVDNSMEVPEGLMKVHRSFFKEKWQMGILLNPGSDVLQGAGFLRRKSGYLDPMPDPAAFIKWDELYRFALNPSTTSKNESDEVDHDKTEYARISLNNTWGDSIVTAINFDPIVVSEIMTAASNQAIPKDTYQVVGYLYGKVVTKPTEEGKSDDYEVFASRFIEIANELAPRDLPGLTLLGWWGQSNVDVMNYLHSAIEYHERLFKDAYHFSCLVNPVTGELRIFTRKHSLEMNNSTIETEEYQLKSLLSR